jgi:hypothetical protein
LEGEAGLSAALAGFQAKKGFVVPKHYSEPRADLSTSGRAKAATRLDQDSRVTTTLMGNCRFAIVWDDEAQSHVYRSGVDVVMARRAARLPRATSSQDSERG